LTEESFDPFHHYYLPTNEGGATGNNNLTHTDLNFYKINNPDNNYNIDPTNGHNGIPVAVNCADAGIWEYFNAPQADTTLWKYGSISSGHYAEMKVHSFSGGGGGIGSFKVLTDIDQDGYSSGVDCDGEDLITSVGIINNFNIKVFPNPTNKAVLVTAKELKGGQIYLYNAAGNLLLQTPFEQEERLDLSLFPAGVYILNIEFEKGHFVERIVRLGSE